MSMMEEMVTYSGVQTEASGFNDMSNWMDP